MITRVFTHLNLGPDNALSSWIVRNLMLRHEIQMVFVNADDDGSTMKDGDIAIDIDAGGRGIKGEQDANGKVHSCAALLVGLYGTDEEQEALKHLVAMVDAQDTYGSPIHHFIPGIDDDTADIFGLTSFSAVLRALQTQDRGNDFLVLQKIWHIIDGLFENGLKRVRAEHEADSIPLYANGKVAFVRNARYMATSHILMRRKVVIVIYQDGYSIGLVRNGLYESSINIDDPIIREVIKKAGETEEWFTHPAGFLVCRGSRKSPARSPSKVDVDQLIEVVQQLVVDIN